jgi:hypothetical protein
VLGATLAHSFLMGGTVFGWPALVTLLEREGQYAELCPAETPPGAHAHTHTCS